MFRLILMVSCLVTATFAVQGQDYAKHKYNMNKDRLDGFDGRFDPIESLRGIIDQIVAWTSDTADELKTTIAGIGDLVLDKLFDIQLEQIVALDESFEELGSDVLQYRTVGTCVDAYLDALHAIKANATDALKQCVQTGVNQVHDLLGDLQANVDAIKDEISTIKNVIAGCQENGGSNHEVALCILENIKQIVKSVKVINRNVIVAIKQGEHRLRIIVTETHLCGADIVIRAKRDALQVRLEAAECLVSNSTKHVNDVFMQ